MPKHYQGESEDSTASKKERMKIKKKKEERDPPPVRRGLKNPRQILKQHMQLLMLRAKEQSEKDTFKRELKRKKDAKSQDRMS